MPPLLPPSRMTTAADGVPAAALLAAGAPQPEPQLHSAEPIIGASQVAAAAAVAAAPEARMVVKQWSEELQGVKVYGVFVLLAGSCFVWVGDSQKAMPNLCAASTTKYSPIPAVSTLMDQAATTAGQSGSGGQLSERSEAFAQHLAKKLGAGTMVTASYQLPSEPRLLHDVVQKKVAEMLLPLVSPPAC